ncbi:uncharacterized protein LOC125859013 [Solanum stenotomum]|uniref:uncharacterized protein LOC125859013 n=1 Tax=Solanum stenotomum TaxID=172797 RepID=UPI0020D10A0E|nr:uncharacterized protein LOC125859013 [Solanum stenotomum]
MVVFALNIWRQYLYDVHVDVFTDNKCLQYVFKKNDLNLPQHRWLELLKDYDSSVLDYPEKICVVANALSQLSMNSVAHVEKGKKQLACDVHRLAWLRVCLVNSIEGDVTVDNGAESSYVFDVKYNKGLDPIFVELKEVMLKRSVEDFSKRGDHVL